MSWSSLGGPLLIRELIWGSKLIRSFDILTKEITYASQYLPPKDKNDYKNCQQQPPHTNLKALSFINYIDISKNPCGS